MVSDTKKVGIILAILHILYYLLWIIEADAVEGWKPLDKPCLCKEFRCQDGIFCLAPERVCDGVRDCPGGEDERRPDSDAIVNSGTIMNKKCKRGFKSNCTSDEFKCKFGDCVKLTKVCNGQIDCWGGVDEAIDFCTWVNSK